MKRRKINYRLLTTIFACLSAFLLGLIISNHRVNAAAFSNSSITYNDNQLLSTNSNSCKGTIGSPFAFTNRKYYFNYACTPGMYQTFILMNGSKNGSTITFDSRYIISSTGINLDSNFSSATLIINSDNIVVTYNDDTNIFYIETTGGYTELQYQEYGQQQYSAGVSTGESNVTSDPNSYNLYTSAQYNSYGTSQYNSGVTAGESNVTSNPNNYNLYTGTQYASYGSSQYDSGVSAGESNVTSNPNDYNLYTSEQYNSYGTSRYNTGYDDGYDFGVVAGSSSVMLNPHNYGLYTTEEYNSYGTSQYNDGVSAGESNVMMSPHAYDLYSSYDMLIRYNEGVSAGESNVTSNPNNYNLYTSAQYTSYGSSQYDSGVSAGESNVTSNPNNYNLYTSAQYTNYGNTRYNDGISVGENNVTTSPNSYDLYSEQQYETYGEEQYEDGYDDAFSELLTYTGVLSLDYAHIEYGNDGTQYNVNNVSDGNTISMINMYNADDFNTNQTDYIFKLNKYISLNSNLIFNFSGEIDSQLNNSTYVDFYKDNLSNSIFRVSYAELINYNGDLKRLVEDSYLTYPVFNYIRLSINPDSSTGLALMRSNTSLTSINVANAAINYNVGYNQGYEIGYEEGSNTTNETSYNLGYSEGYNYATENASENSLVGVVGAVATTPVTILTSIFNFEFLGINVAAFILSIMTLLVVIWLIKRFI